MPISPYPASRASSSLQPKESVVYKTYFVPLSGVSTEDTITSLYERARSYLR